jgi:hypothetical protein
VSLRIPVELAGRSYEIVVGADATSEVGTLLSGRRRAAIVTQAAIPAAHADQVGAALERAGVAH